MWREDLPLDRGEAGDEALAGGAISRRREVSSRVVGEPCQLRDDGDLARESQAPPGR
jgi:hypothetical protein